MTVRRIVANIACDDVAGCVAFYRDVIGLDVAMDMDWIATLAAPGETMTPQLSVMREGGSGTAVPALSVEVDDLEAILARVRALGVGPSYGPVDEPWGVRRFFVTDPAGRTINILAHRRNG